ncbi:MAG: protein kinase [Candidatus Obscuribacterales bacterium]|nr:protein kinase [Candidatus Obscuribacterales bacterium]
MTANNSNQQPDGAPAICPDCGKVQREIKEGSLTSWIFLESRCQCAIIAKQPDQQSPATPASAPSSGAPNAIPFALPQNATPPAAPPAAPGSVRVWPKPSNDKVPQPVPSPVPHIESNTPPVVASRTSGQPDDMSGPQSAAPVQYDLVPTGTQGVEQILLAVNTQAPDVHDGTASSKPQPVRQKGGWPSPGTHAAPPMPEPATSVHAAPPVTKSDPSTQASPLMHQSVPATHAAPPVPQSAASTHPARPASASPPDSMSVQSRPATQPRDSNQLRATPAPQRGDDALDLVDKVIGRHYRILELIGQGGMSRVYRATHLLLSRTVAVKYINPKFVHDHKSVQRFQQEAKAAAALKHPNICAVNEFGMDEEGRPFLVMDFVDGISLSDVLKTQSPLTPEHALDIIEQVCQALVHAHGYGVVHRDIKPGNIVLTRNLEGREIVKLVDFGLARLTDPEGEKRQNLTKTGEVLGTPYYMSPEQCIGRKVDVRSDLYSVGCVFFELLTGRPPFQHDNTVMTLMAHVNEAPPVLPDNLHSALLSRIVERCLKKDPDNRFQTSSELLREISRAQISAEDGKEEPERHSDSPNVIGNRYEILEMIGQGGMGTVLKARHLALSKFVAIKVLNPGRNFDEQSKKRFEQEAQAGSKLSHPNLVAVFDYGFTVRREPYLVMEYIDGESLEKLVARSENMDLDQFIEVFRQACKALNYIHKNNIVHRDIKPSNIIVQIIEGDCYVKLLDFGVAKILQEGAAAQQLTATGMIFGSPLYMSPEQCIGRKIDLRSDIYSLGCVMYECIAGQPPHQGDNSLHTLHMHINERVPELGLATRGRAAAAIEAVIKRCLEKDPAARFQNATELLAELNAIQGRSDSSFIPAPSSAPPAVALPRQGSTGPAETGRPNPIAVNAPSGVNQRMVQFDLTSRSQPNKTRGSAGTRSETFKDSSPDGATTQSLMKERQPSLAASSPHATWLKLAIPLIVAAVVISFVYPPAQILSNLSFGGITGNTINNSFVKGEASFKNGTSDYDKAMKQYELVLKSADTVKDAEIIGKVFARIGRINFTKERYSQASSDFKKAIRTLKPKMAANKEYYLDSVYGLAQSLSAQRSYERAEEYFSEARKLAAQWDTESKQASIAFESARNEAHNNSKDALELYDQAITMLRKPDGQKDKLAACLVESADLLDSNGDRNLAVTRAKEALGFTNGLGDFREVEQRANALIQKSSRETTSNNREEEKETSLTRYPPISTTNPISMPSQPSVAKPMEVSSPSRAYYQTPVESAAIMRARTDQIQQTMRMMDDLRQTQATEFRKAQDAMKMPSMPASTIQPTFRTVTPSIPSYSTVTPSIPSYSTGSTWSHTAAPTMPTMPSSSFSRSSFPR